jgi:hypothetical protein
MIDFRDQPTWHFGRRFELLAMGTLMALQAKLLDLSGSTAARAPLIHGEVSVVTPDIFFRLRDLQLLECKAKRRHLVWRGGSPDDVPKVPPRTEVSMDGKDYDQYIAASQAWNCPVIVASMAVEDDPEERRAGAYHSLLGRGGVLLVNALHCLGIPRISNNPEHLGRVNWDVRSFMKLAEFDQGRIWKYFYGKDGDPNCLPYRGRWIRKAPREEETPNDRKLIETYRALRPGQDEFEEVKRHIAREYERFWHDTARIR